MVFVLLGLLLIGAINYFLLFHNRGSGYNYSSETQSNLKETVNKQPSETKSNKEV